jgi:hypothetical protein
MPHFADSYSRTTFASQLLLHCTFHNSQTLHSMRVKRHRCLKLLLITETLFTDVKELLKRKEHALLRSVPSRRMDNTKRDAGCKDRTCDLPRPQAM